MKLVIQSIFVPDSTQIQLRVSIMDSRLNFEAPRTKLERNRRVETTMGLEHIDSQMPLHVFISQFTLAYSVAVTSGAAMIQTNFVRKPWTRLRLGPPQVRMVPAARQCWRWKVVARVMIAIILKSRSAEQDTCAAPPIRLQHQCIAIAAENPPGSKSI